MQMVFSFLLSVTWGANNSHIAPLIFQMVNAIHSTGKVPDSVSLSMSWRCASAVGMAIGTLLWGPRLTSVTGVSNSPLLHLWQLS